MNEIEDIDNEEDVKREISEDLWESVDIKEIERLRKEEEERKKDEKKEEIEKLEFEIFKKKREIGLLEDRIRELDGIVM